MLHPRMKHIYVGCDIHRATHTAVILDFFGDKLGEITFENKPSAFEKFLKEVNRHTPEGITPIVALEDVNALGRALACFLISKKIPVKHISGSMTYSERKSKAMLHKTDSADAESIAKVLIREFQTLPDISVNDEYWTLAQLVGRRKAVVKASAILKNQLRVYIMHHFPSYQSFFHEFDCKTGLAFWEKYSSPSKLQGVGIEELGEFLYDHSTGFFGIDRAKLILNAVAKDGDTTTKLQETRDFMVGLSVRQLRQNQEKILELECQIEKILHKFEYKLETLPGVNLVTAAELVAQIGNIDRFASADKLSKYSGISPVQYSSGKTEKLLNNRKGDRCLNHLFFNIAITSIGTGRNKDKPVNPIILEYYKKKLSEGKTKRQAIKAIMRRLVNIVYHMMKNKSEYIMPELPNKENK